MAHGADAISGDFTLGDWLVQPSAGRISRGEAVVKLRPQLVDVLVCLARGNGHTVAKADILQTVWPGQYVVESGLGRCIAELRQALGDAAQAPRYIETIPKRGYRLIVPVQWIDVPPASERPADEPQRRPGEQHPVIGHLNPVAESPVPVADAPPVADALVASPSQPGRAGWHGGRGTWTAAVIILSLVASGGALLWPRFKPAVPGERTHVVLIFENNTGDPVFDEALPLALAVQLERSPVLTILPEHRIREELRIMGRPDNDRVSRPLALEVCQRAGAKAVLAGSLSRLGRNYVIGLDALACASGENVARQQVEVGSPERVLDGLGQAAAGIRGRLGESLAPIRP